MAKSSKAASKPWNPRPEIIAYAVKMANSDPSQASAAKVLIGKISSGRTEVGRRLYNTLAAAYDYEHSKEKDRGANFLRALGIDPNAKGLDTTIVI